MDAPPPIVVVMPVRSELQVLGREMLPPGARIRVQWLAPSKWIIKASVHGRRVGTLVAWVGPDSLRVEPRASMQELAAERAYHQRWKKRAHQRP